MLKKTVDDWFTEIDNALAYRELFGRENAWRKLEMNYLNDPKGDTAIGANLIFAMGDTLNSELTVPDPEFVVRAEKRLGLDKAPIIESLDNYFVRKLRLKRYIDVAILRGFLYGSIILKVGYDSEFGWSPYFDIGEGNNMLGITFTQFDKKGRRIESPDTQPGWPWVRPVLPHDFVVPWGTIFLEDAPWAAHRFVRHVDHLKADVKYKNTSSLVAQMNMQDFMESYLTSGTKKQKLRLRGIAENNRKPEYVECWEIRDRINGEIVVISRDHPKFLRKDVDAIQMACGMPFVSATLNWHPRSFWSTPPAYYLGQIQKTQFDISKQAEKERRISVLRFLFRKGALKKEDLDKLLASDVGAAVGVESQFPMNELIATVPRGTSFDYMAHSETNRQNAREASGLSRNQMGEPLGTPGRRTTGAEVRAVGSGAHRRTSKRAQTVSELYINTIEKVNKIVFEYWQVPREVMHDEGWKVVTGNDLKGDYMYDVSLSTKRNISRAERKIEALMMLTQLAPFLQGADIQALFTYLSDAAGDPGFERILAPLSGKVAQQPAAMPGGPQGGTAAAGAGGPR